MRDGVRYPAVLLRPSAEDSRVPVWQAAKFAARLSAATASGRPVLLRVSGGGHLLSSEALAIEDAIDEESFMLWQLGLAHNPAW